MNRRGFLGSIFAAGVAPAIVRVGSLMAVRPTDALGQRGFILTKFETKALILNDDWLVDIERQIVDRMRLTRELIAYGVITAEDSIVTPNAKDPATIVYRRWLPYKDVVA